MMAPDAGLAALQDVARGLRARIEALDPTSLAWALLWHADELHPWTAGAQACWDRLPHPDDPVSAQDCWRVHHLAVLHHARAYDAENAIPPRRAEALPHWDKALGYWARLHQCTTFWQALQQHLDEATGRQVPPEVVDAVRERLPGDLLAVHTALAAECRVDDPPAATAHMRLVTQSGFPAESVAAARRGLVADLDNHIAQEIRRVRFGPAFDYLVDWLAIDPANPWLLRNLLYVTDSWARFLNKQPNWISQVASMLERTEQALQAARVRQGNVPALLADELAKYEFWRGFPLLCDIPRDHTACSPDVLRTRLRSAEAAASHLRKALDLDPSVRLEYYYEPDLHLARALTVRAELKLLLGWDLHEVEHDLTEAHRYRPDLPETLEVLTRLRAIRRERGLDEGPLELITPKQQALEHSAAKRNATTVTRATAKAPSDGLSAWDLADRGETYRLGDRLDEALDHFNRAIDLKPDFAVALSRRGQTYAALDRLDEALADLNRAIELKPDDTSIINHRGHIYRRMKRYELAIADQSQAINLEPGSVWLVASRGQTYRFMNRLDEALADFNHAIDLNPRYAWALAQRGDTYRLLHHYDQALADLNRAIDLDPGAAWQFSCRGVTFRRLNRFDEALADLNHAIDIFDRLTYLDKDHLWALAERAETCRLLHRYDEGLADLNRVLDLNPTDGFARAVRGDINRLKGRYEEALADLTGALDLNHDPPWSLAHRGDTYRLLNRYDEALADLNRSLDLNPNDAFAHASRGEIYRNLSRFDEALADLNRSLDLNPNDTWAIAIRGQTYRNLNRFDEALADYTRAIDLNPNDSWTIARRDEIYRLMSR